MRSGRIFGLAGALLAPTLMLGGIVPLAPLATSGSIVKAGDIVFTRSGLSACPNNTQIAQLKPDGSITDLSGCQAEDQMPAVSPDGSKIVYQSLGHMDANGTGEPVLDGLYVMSSSGADKTQITQVHASDSRTNPCPCYGFVNPSWNPAGTQIVFTRGTSSGAEIDKVNADGSGLTTLINDTTSGSTIMTGGPSSWSPDGTRIVYTFGTSSSSGIYVMNADGSNQHEVVNASVAGGFVEVPTWSPGGTRIYFDNGWNIFGVNADGSSLTQLTDSNQYGGNAYEPTVSSDGSTLVYTDNLQLYSISASANMQAGTPLASGFHSNEPAYVWATWPNANTQNLVALGDSVAAGEGINYGFIWENGKWVRTGPSSPSWTDTTGALGANYPGCHQSGKGYPALLSLDGGNFNVYNMACTGATALQNNGLESGGVLDREVLNDGTSPPAQLGGTCTGCDPPSTMFNGHRPAIVTLTLGANDINFANWVVKCYTSTCGTSADTQTLDSQLALEKADLATVLSQLDAWTGRKNKALRVLITNYYDPFNANNDSCRDYKLGTVVMLTGSELAWLENGLTDLNANIAKGVKEAQNSDTHLKVSLVDLSDIMSGHQWCSSSPWVYGVSIDYSLKNVFLGFNLAPFHPTSAGQHKIYMAIKAHLP